jgi:hypothetical protein
MRTTLLVLAFVALTSACKNSEAAAGKKSDLVTKLDALADRVCACADEACATAAAADLDALAKNTTNVAEDDFAPAQAAQAKFDECHAKHYKVVTDYLALTDEICACTDKKCGEQVAAKVTKWSKALKASGQKLRPGDIQVISHRGQEGGQCFTKLGVAIPK